MTMFSFRVNDELAEDVRRWAERLERDRSDLLREAICLYLLRLASEAEAERWPDLALDEGERALQDVADWGPAEDWSDWSDATG